MATFGGLQQALALIATATTIIVSVLAFRSKADRIRVVFDHLHPPLDPGDALYVVSRRDHQMKLRDYGFVNEKGGLLSLPDFYTHEWDGGDEMPVHGRTDLEKRGEIFAVGPIEFGDKQIGAFAITAGQRFRRVAFHADIPWHVRLKLRLKIVFKPHHQ